MSKHIQGSPNQTQWMEELSAAYLHAAASSACCTLSCERPDVNKIDWILKRAPFLHGVQVQLKSVCEPEATQTEIVYDLEAATYNHLVQFNRDLPAFLCLMVFPQLGQTWVDSGSDERLEIRRSMYWCFVGGSAQSPNASSVRVRIPRTHRLSAGWLTALFNALGSGESLDGVLS